MKNKNIDMINGSLFGKMVSYTIPLILSGVLQLLYNAADLIVVGQFTGPEAFAAVGATGSLTNLFTTFFIALANGGCICVAQYYGARDAKNVFETVHTCVLVSILGGLFMGIFGMMFAKPALRLMGTHEDILDMSTLYMQIIFASFPFTLFYNFAAGIMRAAGDTKTPFYILVITGIINILLNLLLVIVFKLGVAGVAIATAIGAILNALFCGIILARTGDITYINFKKLKIYKDKLIKIFNYGVPSGVQSLLFSISNVMIQSSINSFNSVAVVAGCSAAASIEGFIYVAMNSVAQTALNFSGQNFGARKYHRVTRTLICGCVMATVVGILFGAAAIIFKTPLLEIYQPDDPEALVAGYERLRVIASTYFLCGVYEVFAMVLRSIGSTWIPAGISAFSICGLRIVWIYTIFQKFHTITVLCLSYTVSWIIIIVTLFALYLLRRKHYFEKNEKQYS